MAALADANYVSACGLLDSGTQVALISSTGMPTKCPRVFARCLPNEAAILRRDQTQLFYANIDITVNGSKATADVSGTAVAKQIRQVDLRRERGVWLLTSPGQALANCPLTHRWRRHAGLN